MACGQFKFRSRIGVPRLLSSFVARDDTIEETQCTRGSDEARTASVRDGSKQARAASPQNEFQSSPDIILSAGKRRQQRGTHDAQDQPPDRAVFYCPDFS